jgi:hypothetical protein
MRQIGDPPADRIMAALTVQDQIDSVNHLMRDLVRNDVLPPDAMSPVVRDYFETTDDLPSWADEEQLRAGQEFFNRFGPQIALVLNTYSLPMCYTAAKGVQVLYRTAQMYTNPRRRIVETSQMIIDVMQAGGLARGGYGVRSAQKVRLMHAGVRYLLLKHDWNSAWGVPINQEDLAGTLVSFSAMVLDGLMKLGVDVTAAERDAYVHAWNVVGHILGLQAPLIPGNFDDAARLGQCIFDRQRGYTPEGEYLLKSLIECMQYATPGTLFDGFPITLIRFFMGDELSDEFHVPPTDWTRHVMRPLQLLFSLSDDTGDVIQPVARLSEMFGRKLLEGYCFMDRGGERHSFNIPTQLRQAWGIS